MNEALHGKMQGNDIGYLMVKTWECTLVSKLHHHNNLYAY